MEEKNLNKNIAGIRNAMTEMKAEMYAIKNPELAELDEYRKTLYLKVLCTVLQYENTPSDMQILYLKRLLKGLGADEPVEEYMRKALDISDVDIREFVGYMKDSRIKYYFALEGILLISMGDYSADTYEYLAELIELTGISKDELRGVSLVAKSVLQQDSAYYDQAKELLTDDLQQVNFAPYIKNYYAGAILDTQHEKYYSAPKGETLQLTLSGVHKAEKITYDNLVLYVDAGCNFDGCECVTISNCKLMPANNGSIRFESIGKLQIENCEFLDFENRVAFFARVNSIQINGCRFENCGFTCTGDRRGGVFGTACLNNAVKFEFNGNKVRKCYIKAKERQPFYGVSGVLICLSGSYNEGLLFDFLDKSKKVEVAICDNQFIDCQCINNGRYTEAIISGISSEMDGVKIQNNQCIGSLTRLLE